MNPCMHFRRWVEYANSQGILKASAMCLSTVSSDGNPSSRMMLMSGITEDGIFFCTDVRSKKVRDIEENDRACALTYWPSLGRQVRITGVVELLADSIACSEFNGKTHEQKTAIMISPQSQRIKSHRELSRMFSAVLKDANPAAPEKPPHWRSFLLRPLSIEFFKSYPGRLNKRVVFEKHEARGWTTKYLAP